MQVWGLTGGIACGKSHISGLLSGLGAVIVDGDLLSRELTHPEGRALAPLRRAFGDGFFHRDGTLNRRALGTLVFSDDRARETLDGIMQPMIRALILERMDAARAAGAEVCILDMPLLYEQGLDTWCDRVWCAYLPREEQLNRLMARDGFTREEAENRLASQLPAKEKANRADRIIDTSGSMAQTKELVIAAYAEDRAGG